MTECHPPRHNNTPLQIVETIDDHNRNNEKPPSLDDHDDTSLRRNNFLGRTCHIPRMELYTKTDFKTLMGNIKLLQKNRLG